MREKRGRERERERERERDLRDTSQRQIVRHNSAGCIIIFIFFLSKISNLKQVAILRNPSLRDKPVGVRQKYLIVTTNYVARRAGMKKMIKVSEAKKQCPELVVIDGENLDPYREVC